MNHLFKNSNYKKELNDVSKMTTKEVEDLVKQEWEEYFPLFSRVMDLEKITKDKTADDKTICEAYKELIAIYPSYRKLEAQHLMHLQILESKLLASMTDEQMRSLESMRM